MIIDNHVHVGWYTDGYHSPSEIWKQVKLSPVDEICVSSTSTCAELYKVVVREMHELTRLGGAKVHPLLWLTPRMFRTYGLRFMLHSKIKWQGVKIHPESHPEWSHNKSLARRAVAVAQQLNVPMLIHSGNFPVSEANNFRYLFEEFPAQTFVVAHGRPFAQILQIMTECPNVWVDTAFMPIEDVCTLVSEGLSDRILFGSDIPINHCYFPEMSTHDYLRQQLSNLKRCLPSHFNEITQRSVYV